MADTVRAACLSADFTPHANHTRGKRVLYRTFQTPPNLGLAGLPCLRHICLPQCRKSRAIREIVAKAVGAFSG